MVVQNDKFVWNLFVTFPPIHTHTYINQAALCTLCLQAAHQTISNSTLLQFHQTLFYRRHLEGKCVERPLEYVEKKTGNAESSLHQENF